MSRNRAYLILAGCLFTLPVLCGVFGFTNVLSQKAKSPRSSWMKDVSDDTAIEDLDIVGSHESLALYGIGDLAGQCQSLPIGEQLELGVRLFDIRLKVSGASLHAYHGFVDERQKFHETISTLHSFLANHPSEALFISIKTEDSEGENAARFDKLVEQQIDPTRWYLDATMPSTLGQVRGKMVLLSRYANASHGVDWHNGWRDNKSFSLGESFYVQDQYALDSIEKKKEAITACYARAETFKINYFSGYLTNHFPPMHAPTFAKEINGWAKTYLPSVSKKGFMFFDFVNTELMDVVYGGGQQ